MNDIIKIVQALGDSNILLKGVTKTIENETKEQKEGFLSTLLGTLGASLLGNLLTGTELKEQDLEIIKEKELKELVPVVFCPLLRKSNWIFNEASSFNKL